jgi:hypothetical protein
MAKTETIHTPDEPKLLKISFGGCRINSVTLSDAATGSFSFHCKVGNGKPLETLCRRMKWQVPEEHTPEIKLDGKLEGGTLTLLCETTLGKNVEIKLPYKVMKDFRIVRLELLAKKKKGFRRELRFSGTFDDAEGAATFESYMNRTNNADGHLTITYLKDPDTQSELPLADPTAAQATTAENY